MKVTGCMYLLNRWYLTGVVTLCDKMQPEIGMFPSLSFLVYTRHAYRKIIIKVGRIAPKYRSFVYLFLKASVMAQTVIDKAWNEFLAWTVNCFLRWSPHEKWFLKALLMNECLKNELQSLVDGSRLEKWENHVHRILMPHGSPLTGSYNRAVFRRESWSDNANCIRLHC